MKRFFLLVPLLVVTVVASGCSVSRAAKKTGVDVTKVTACSSTQCLLALPSAEILEKTKFDEGQTKYRIRYQKRQGSFIRALGYGGAAVFTLGLSEVVATPIEGAIQNDKQFLVDAICHDTSSDCAAILLFESGVDPVVVKGDPKFFTAEEITEEPQSVVVSEAGIDPSGS